MRRAAARIAALAAFVILLFGAARAAAETPREPLEHFPAADLELASHGHFYRFHVRLATTDPRREQGLMFVKKLGRDEGMLFLWQAPRVTGFWMKNTLIPLDLLFVAADGRIIRIAADAVPMSEAVISSMGPVLGVLELAGGTTQRLAIATGDRILYPAFGDR